MPEMHNTSFKGASFNVLTSAPTHTTTSYVWRALKAENEQLASSQKLTATAEAIFTAGIFTVQSDWGIIKSSDIGREKISQDAQRKSELINELMRYEMLPRDWDGEGGLAPTRETIRNAISFLDGLAPDISLPKTMVEGDGEAALYWESANGYLEVGFKDKSIAFWGIVHTSRGPIEIEGEQAYDKNRLPVDIFELVRGI